MILTADDVVAAGNEFVMSNSNAILETTANQVTSTAASDVSLSGNLATDPLLAGGLLLAIIALAGLGFTSQMEDEGYSNTVLRSSSATPTPPSTPPPPDSFDGDNTTTTTTTTTTTPPTTTPVTPTRLAATTTAKSTIMDEDLDELISIGSSDGTVVVDEDVGQELSSINDALQSDNRKGLRAGLSRLVEMVSSAREKLGQEQTLRQDVERKLEFVAEEIRVLEDKYELEQNALKRKQHELEASQMALASKEKELQVTAESLAKLEEERSSLRSLAKVAWQLSKTRVQTRVKKVFRRNEET